MNHSGGYLRRLAPQFYQGNSMVHWSMTIDQRKAGWLTTHLHLRFREALLHTLCRYNLICPIYCLMPDHIHLLWMGTSQPTDQLRAASFFRKHFNLLLKSNGFALMEQAYDHVLREHEREKGAFEATLFYIAENPARAKLIADAGNWKFSGSQAAGYPDFDWRDKQFSDKIWKLYATECASSTQRE